LLLLYVNHFNSMDDAVWTYFFNEAHSIAIVSDSKPQHMIRFHDFDLFTLSATMSVDRVVHTDLTAQQSIHVHSMSVQRAIHDLIRTCHQG
jgi:hypothetical protein